MCSELKKSDCTRSSSSECLECFGDWQTAICTANRRRIRVDPIPIPPLPFARARIRRERLTKQDMDDFGTTVWIGRMETAEHQQYQQNNQQYQCRTNSEQSQSSLTGIPRRAMWAATSQSQAETVHELGVVSNQRQWTTTDVEAEPSDMEPHIRRRMAQKSFSRSTVAVTTQEALDGYREKP